jgi:hypothetical protein
VCECGGGGGGTNLALQYARILLTFTHTHTHTHTHNCTRAHTQPHPQTSMEGNFLKDCKISLSDHEKEQRSNYFRVAISGNMIPPPERGLFGENYAVNADTLVRRARQIIWG